MRFLWTWVMVVALALIGIGGSATAEPAGEAPALGERLSQQTVEHRLSTRELRREGLRIFSTPFNRLDGLGDGPVDPLNEIDPGGRPTLGNNGMFLRMNGLDSQTCLECHNVLSNATVPARFAVGGVGGVGASAFPGVIQPDVGDSENNGFAAIQGRMINPPFSFGAGGVELLGKEMTADLQALKAFAQANPGQPIALLTHGVSFGTLVFDGSDFDFSGLKGIDDDLVVRPFGRKGCCHSIREFDKGAMQFHHGIQPVEVVGEDVDADGDGVVNELTVGELSALHVFQASLDRPRRERRLNRRERNGRALLEEIGCTECHRPYLVTESRQLTVSFPEVAADPSANVYKSLDLSRPPTGFSRSRGGIVVPLYADLKRHEMGSGLQETTGDALDRWFQTARLWGVADTAPYLHDGRATTLSDAILMHGGEAEASRDAFDLLLDHEKRDLLEFLRTLRTPRNPSADLGP